MLRGDSVHFRSDAALNVGRQHAISKEIIIPTIGKYTQPNRVIIVVSQLCIVQKYENESFSYFSCCIQKGEKMASSSRISPRVFGAEVVLLLPPLPPANYLD